MLISDIRFLVNWRQSVFCRGDQFLYSIGNISPTRTHIGPIRHLRHLTHVVRQKIVHPETQSTHSVALSVEEKVAQLRRRVKIRWKGFNVKIEVSEKHRGLTEQDHIFCSRKVFLKKLSLLLLKRLFFLLFERSCSNKQELTVISFHSMSFFL